MFTTKKTLYEVIVIGKQKRFAISKKKKMRKLLHHGLVESSVTNSLLLTQNTMTTRFTYDIQTQQLVYAIVDKDGVCKYLTTSITDAIRLTQQN